MDGIALELYTLKKKVLVFSKPQIFFKKIETLSSYPDRALLGQLEDVKEEVSGNGAGLREGCKGIPLVEPSHVGGAARATACTCVLRVPVCCVCTCVLRVCTHSPLSLAGPPEPASMASLVPLCSICTCVSSTRLNLRSEGWSLPESSSHLSCSGCAAAHPWKVQARWAQVSPSPEVTRRFLARGSVCT